MRRYFIQSGDKTTSGAVVIEGEQRARHHGVSLAFMGATVHCPTCESNGHIVATGPRRRLGFMGKELVLSDDICMCECQPPPRLIPSQHDSFESFTADESYGMGFTPGGRSLLRHHDEQITLRDAYTRRPLANVAYRLRDGARILTTGRTDATGRTNRVVTDALSNVVIEVEHGR